MMAIVMIEAGEPAGWIIGTDTHDLRRKVMSANIEGLHDMNVIESELYKIESPGPGKYQLVLNVWLLVY